MKLAHLILAHTYNAQLLRLIKSLAHADADIYLHIDKKADTTTFDELLVNPTVHLITNRVKVDWGNYNMVQATLNSFEEILSNGITYSHINLLSGQDYPLKAPETIHEFLFANADKTFMRYKSIPDEWIDGASRFKLYNLGDYHIPGIHKIQNLLNKILPARKAPAHLKLYGISQWFTITPECALYVINYLKQNKKVWRFFKFTWAVDEVIFQTILVNSPLKDKIVTDHLRYIRFKDSASRPTILTIADAFHITESGKFYARKFDATVDTEILDYLDKEMVKTPLPNNTLSLQGLTP